MRINDLERDVQDYNLDKLSLASKYHELAVLSIKDSGQGGENFEKAGNILENYWTLTHLKGHKDYFHNKKILLNALKNYTLAKQFYASKGLKLSESRVSARIADLKNQLRNYGNILRSLIAFLVVISFFSSITIFSSSITGFSVVSLDEDRSLFLGGFLLLLGFIGATYILFLGYFLTYQEDILS